MAHRVIAGATGLIGKRVTELWLEQGYELTLIGRSIQRIEQTFGIGKVKAVTWNKLTRHDLEGAEIILNLTGENVGNKSWTNNQKKEIINSRVGSTKRLATLISEMPSAPALYNASAIGIYGLQGQMAQSLPPRLDEENSKIDFTNPSDFMSLVATKWERAAEPAIAAGKRVVFLRFGVVLAKEGGALPKLMKPFKYYLGGPLGTGNQPVSWVGIDDVVRAIDFLVNKPDASGPYNIVAPGVVKQGMFAEQLGKSTGHPGVVRMPAFLLRFMVGREFADELLLEGQNIYPKRLLDAGFVFAYPDLESTLNRIFLVKSGRMKFFIK